jgi:hypothetical protein
LAVMPFPTNTPPTIKRKLTIDFLLTTISHGD